MKKRINITISEEALLIADESGNRSEYIENLIISTSYGSLRTESKAGLSKEEVLDLIKTTISTHGYSTEPVRVPPAIPGLTTGAAFVPKPPDPETGYPCCTKQAPCKHWIFNGAESHWKNELTGKTREVI